MNRFLGKFDFVLVLLQCLGIQFIYTGVYRLYIAYNKEKWDVLLGESLESYESLANVRWSDFLADSMTWKLTLACAVMTAVILLNNRYKVGELNTIIVVMLTVFFTRAGFFMSPYFYWRIDYFSSVFPENTKSSFLISGFLFLCVSLSIIWRSIVLSVKSRQ